MNISNKEYDAAIKVKEGAEKIINQFHKERAEAFEARLRNGAYFTEDELHYAAHARCPCGHGMAYPKDCTPNHYWDCSAILKGIADRKVEHSARLPFMFYEIRGESEQRGTTRGVNMPKTGEESGG